MPRRKTPPPAPDVPEHPSDIELHNGDRLAQESPTPEDQATKLLEEFKRQFDAFYTSSLRWQRHEDDAPSLIYVRNVFHDWLIGLKGFLHRHANYPAMSDFLDEVKRVVLDYTFQDQPFISNGVIDRRFSHVRSNYRTGDADVDNRLPLSQLDEMAEDREHVLRLERIQLWERVEHLMRDLQLEQMGSNSILRNAERLLWKGSVAEFEYIFSTLAEKGYFDIPLKGGKAGDRNITAMARALMQCFDLRVDGKEITIENLRQRFSPGSSSKLSESKQEKYNIPGPGELVIPPSEGQ